MNILEILGVDVAQPYVIGTFSTAGQGKAREKSSNNFFLKLFYSN
jgi:hypothetical protein